jgi:hypothetical protein
LAARPAQQLSIAAFARWRNGYHKSVRQSARSHSRLHPQVRPNYGSQYKTPNLNEDRGFVVLVAGLEPARYFYRGILRLGGAKIAVFWVIQQSAKRGKIARKTPKNAPKSTFRATVQNPQKITKKCNLPKSTRRKLTKSAILAYFHEK